ITRIGRWPPCSTNRPFAFSSSRLPASTNSLLGTSILHISRGRRVLGAEHRYPSVQRERSPSSDYRGSSENVCSTVDNRSSAAGGKGPFSTAASAFSN